MTHVSAPYFVPDGRFETLNPTKGLRIVFRTLTFPNFRPVIQGSSSVSPSSQKSDGSRSIVSLFIKRKGVYNWVIVRVEPVLKDGDFLYIQLVKTCPSSSSLTSGSVILVFVSGLVVRFRSPNPQIQEYSVSAYLSEYWGTGSQRSRLVRVVPSPQLPW